MKVYLLSPSFDVLAAENRNEATFRPYLDAVVSVVIDAIQPSGSERLLGVWDVGEVGTDKEPFDDEYAGRRVKDLRDRELLLSCLRRAADPFDGFYMWVRCLTTCRSVRFLHDGYALLCLPHADPPPPMSSLIRVEDHSWRLSETDDLDGYIDGEDQEPKDNVVALPTR